MSCNTRSVQVSQLAVNHATTCSCKLSSISLQVTLSVNTINTRQNRIKVGNPRHLTAEMSYTAGHQEKLGQKLLTEKLQIKVFTLYSQI